MDWAPLLGMHINQTGKKTVAICKVNTSQVKGDNNKSLEIMSLGAGNNTKYHFNTNQH